MILWGSFTYIVSWSSCRGLLSSTVRGEANIGNGLLGLIYIDYWWLGLSTRVPSCLWSHRPYTCPWIWGGGDSPALSSFAIRHGLLTSAGWRTLRSWTFLVLDALRILGIELPVVIGASRVYSYPSYIVSRSSKLDWRLRYFTLPFAREETLSNTFVWFSQSTLLNILHLLFLFARLFVFRQNHSVFVVHRSDCGNRLPVLMQFISQLSYDGGIIDSSSIRFPNCRRNSLRRFNSIFFPFFISSSLDRLFNVTRFILLNFTLILVLRSAFR